MVDSVGEFKRAWSSVKGEGDKATAVKLWTGAMPHPERAELHNDMKKWHAEVEALGGYEFVRNFPIHPFFRALRSHAPGKYEKAVKEFAKAVA